MHSFQGHALELALEGRSPSEDRWCGGPQGRHERSGSNWQRLVVVLVRLVFILAWFCVLLGWFCVACLVAAPSDVR
jgi:hypothetical protein